MGPESVEDTEDLGDCKTNMKTKTESNQNKTKGTCKQKLNTINNTR